MAELTSKSAVTFVTCEHLTILLSTLMLHKLTCDIIVNIFCSPTNTLELAFSYC